ncbi:hypothetical protein AVEN_221335-1 [Araneus ventricosus]|uniref:Uncharacterized protein n=1 Tax=Araneus ventricosus TaxID=182803 RepID=A0A4Y2B108_ARAVE|nr:hypothetical protein AVEN_221335-1 [Araneus ventricosus]
MVDPSLDGQKHIICVLNDKTKTRVPSPRRPPPISAPPLLLYPATGSDLDLPHGVYIWPDIALVVDCLRVDPYSTLQIF